jgi:hypothetical protein
MSAPSQLIWSAEVAPALHGLSLAREGGRVLAWHARHGLFLFDARGLPLGHRPASSKIVGACCAGDGASVAEIDAAGHVSLLGNDLTPRWERPLPQGTAVAMDSFGRRVAAADGSGGLTLFDRKGDTLWRTTWPRPLRYVAFVPELAVLVASADFGLVVCCDTAGRCAWRDAPVTHAGSLAVSGNGGVVALAHYSDGLCCYATSRSHGKDLREAAPCRLADVAYDGKTFLTAGLDHRVFLRDAEGFARAEWELSDRPVGLALSPVADRAAAALANGKVQVWSTRAG